MGEGERTLHQGGGAAYRPREGDPPLRHHGSGEGDVWGGWLCPTAAESGPGEMAPRRGTMSAAAVMLPSAKVPGPLTALLPGQLLRDQGGRELDLLSAFTVIFFMRRRDWW